MRDFVTSKGYIREVSSRDLNKLPYGVFSFRKFLRDGLTEMNVPHFDRCCDTADDIAPVRANDGVLEVYDDATNTWGAFSLETVASDAVSSSTTNSNLTLSGNGTGFVVANDYLVANQSVTQKHSPVAINATATATAAQVHAGVITSTSAAAVALTLPTATALGTELGAVQGTWFDLAVDNSAGANTVTVTMNTGITAITAVLTGGATMTVASGVVGIFRIYFTSATVAKIARIV